MLPVRERAVSRVVTSRESNNSVPGNPIIRAFTLLACCALNNNCCQEHSRAKTMTNLPASVTAEVNRT